MKKTLALFAFLLAGCSSSTSPSNTTQTNKHGSAIGTWIQGDPREGFVLKIDSGSGGLTGMMSIVYDTTGTNIQNLPATVSEFKYGAVLFSAPVDTYDSYTFRLDFHGDSLVGTRDWNYTNPANPFHRFDPIGFIRQS